MSDQGGDTSGPETTDYSLHTADELREGIEKTEELEPHVREEGSDEALEAQRAQRQAMQDELDRRES
ncbi:MAG TPA: hypothetical protein VGV67_00660 [Solirubrobacteraceae bacterium]|nr:hypothetical protein [Solirubrobacteraceae bacterium]